MSKCLVESYTIRTAGFMLKFAFMTEAEEMIEARTFQLTSCKSSVCSASRVVHTSSHPSVMRFKISTHPPLPEAKAWCPLPTSDSDPSPTVRTLKTHLVRSFPTVRAYSATVEELVLEVDGFELLDESVLADLALTGGDVIEYVRARLQTPLEYED